MSTVPGVAVALWVFSDEHGESIAGMCDHHADEHDWTVGDAAEARDCDQDLDCEQCAVEMGWESPGIAPTSA